MQTNEVRIVMRAPNRVRANMFSCQIELVMAGSAPSHSEARCVHKDIVRGDYGLQLSPNAGWWRNGGCV